MAKDIQVNSLEDLSRIMARMRQFSRIHNTYRQDTEILFKKLDESEGNPFKMRSLYRSIIHSFFSMIESDLYSYNDLHAYKKYDDRDGFKEKFKKTFKNICKAIEKEELQKEYWKRRLAILFKLRNQRDGLFHAKKLEDVHEASLKDIDNLKVIVSDYNDLITNLMDGFFFDLSKLEGEQDQVSAIINS